MNRNVILVGLLMCSCQQSQPPVSVGTATPVTLASATATPTHHEHKAPRGGALVELGEEAAHLEVLWDTEKGKMVVYCIDGECEKPLRSTQKELRFQVGQQTFVLKAVANPLTGETIGDSSQFEGELTELKSKDKWEGKFVEITLQGQVYQNLDFDYPPSQEHSHSH